MSSDYARVAAAIRFLDAHVDAQPTVPALARALGLSTSHCHRLFQRWAGVTPKDFLQVLTLARARGLLQDQRTLLDTSHALGLSGTGRLHDLFVTHEAMTPGQYKAGADGLTVSWTLVETPLGRALMAATPRGLCHLAFLDDTIVADALLDLARRWPRATLSRAPDALAPLAASLNARLARAAGAPLPLALRGTPFQLKVWEALLRIPEGRATTYGQLARALGHPRAARAVGAAVGANPVAVLIPCHRVIHQSGALGDYRWDPTRKAALLALEGARHRAADPSPRPARA